jgi:hypothetical protein
MGAMKYTAVTIGTSSTGMRTTTRFMAETNDDLTGNNGGDTILDNQAPGDEVTSGPDADYVDVTDGQLDDNMDAGDGSDECWVNWHVVAGGPDQSDGHHDCETLHKAYV